MSPPASSQPTPTLPLVDLEAIHQRNAAIITRVQALQDAGFRCVPVRSDAQKQLVYPESGTRSYLPTAFCGHTIAIRTGRLADGSYLVRLDLDQHTETQDAEAALDRLMPLIESLPEKFAYKRSTGGQGYDVIFRSPRELPNNQRFALDGCWAGEVFCERGRVVDAGWIAGSPETLVVLTEPELDYLLTLVTIYGTNTAQEVSWQTRKREGLPLIAVYETVNIARFLGPTGMPKSFAGSKLPHQIAQSNWRRLGTARKGQRSEVYAMYVQSLMLLATSSYGMTTEEKCRTVAAIAITHCPRSDQSREQIANDTAVLIARILHGDPYAHRTGNFLVPAWAAAYQAPVRSRG
ncbi:MAG: hypothetical protein HGA45_17320, partial [Chloroflexales bacterium]|nr:hypothetical protein [Chloroflexales bacterium]